MQNGRLTYYLQSANQEFWEQQWAQSDLDRAYAAASEGRLGHFERWFPAFLPKQGRIVEAGCGLAQHVVALRERGYSVEGIDWAPQTVERVKRRFPDLPIRVGDVLRIDVPDDHYSGYISLGVVEHRLAGPEPFIGEALRVLKPGGTAIFTVPFVNLARRMKTAMGAYKSKPVAGDFYQYAFPRQEFVNLVRQMGFQVVTTGAYDSYKGILDEFPLLKRPLGVSLGRYHLGAVVQRMLSTVKWVEDRFGHMLIVVARKPHTAGDR
jgi:SAM-dependent methyltransferase